LKNQLGAANTSSSSGKGSNSGCYIATMAYGDYDHPKVLVLRNFRDETLERHLLGRWFIRAYYTTSPSLVKLLKNQKTVNNLIRATLNQLVKILK
jgi:hypothetical protein